MKALRLIVQLSLDEIMEILFSGKKDLIPKDINIIDDISESHSDDIVYISDNKSGEMSDLDYFLKNSTSGNWVAYSITENTGESLFDFESGKNQNLGDDYADGGVEVGLYRGNKAFISSILNGQINTPFNYLFMGAAREDYNIKKPALFLDRDGIINKDFGYCIDKNKTELVSGIEDLIKWANGNNMYVVVLTNQSGVARGIYTEAELKGYHCYLEKLLSDKGAHIDLWQYCPFHFEAGKGSYSKKSFCRKPWPGMALKSCDVLPIDLGKSIMLGDKVSDALDIKGLTNLHLKGQYDLSNCENPVFNKISEVITYLS